MGIGKVRKTIFEFVFYLHQSLRGFHNHMEKAHEVYQCKCGREFVKMGKRSAKARYERHQVSLKYCTFLFVKERKLHMSFFYVTVLKKSKNEVNISVSALYPAHSFFGVLLI